MTTDSEGMGWILSGAGGLGIGRFAMGRNRAKLGQERVGILHGRSGKDLAFVPVEVDLSDVERFGLSVLFPVTLNPTDPRHTDSVPNAL